MPISPDPDPRPDPLRFDPPESDYQDRARQAEPGPLRWWRRVRSRRQPPRMSPEQVVAQLRSWGLSAYSTDDGLVIVEDLSGHHRRLLEQVREAYAENDPSPDWQSFAEVHSQQGWTVKSDGTIDETEGRGASERSGDPQEPDGPRASAPSDTRSETPVSSDEVQTRVHLPQFVAPWPQHKGVGGKALCGSAGSGISGYWEYVDCAACLEAGGPVHLIDAAAGAVTCGAGGDVRCSHDIERVTCSDCLRRRVFDPSPGEIPVVRDDPYRTNLEKIRARMAPEDLVAPEDRQGIARDRRLSTEERDERLSRLRAEIPGDEGLQRPTPSVAKPERWRLAKGVWHVCSDVSWRTACGLDPQYFEHEVVGRVPGPLVHSRRCPVCLKMAEGQTPSIWDWAGRHAGYSGSPGACHGDSLYWCPTVQEIECPEHGGFDVCCDHPELHWDMDRIEKFLRANDPQEDS